MEGDREPLTALIICSSIQGKGMSFWHGLWVEMSLGVITSNKNRNDKVSSGGTQGHHEQNGLNAIHTRAGKVILKFFFDQDGHFLIEFLQHGTTVNAQSYLQSLITVHQAMKSKRPEKLTRVVILLHDNARLHTAVTITALLQKFKWEVLGHPPYSPDLSPCDYAIFGPIEKALGEK